MEDLTEINARSSTKQLSSEEQLLSAEYRIQPETFWTLSMMRGDDGRERMDAARVTHWKPISSWGRDGWDLGSWPLVVIYHRTTEDAWQLAENVEGGVAVYSYTSQELRDAATDCLAFFHWKQRDEAWVVDIDTVDAAPDCLRGPFSWSRLQQERS